MTTAQPTETENAIARLTRDIKDAARTLTDEEARFLVDAYYTMQGDRITANNQLRTLGAGGEPHSVMEWLAEQRSKLERQVAGALDVYSDSKPAGKWSRSIVGIGPIIAAGLLAHIQLERTDRETGEVTLQAPTVGHIWRFAGLDPTVKWNKGERRPWNADLKRLCWLIGESFTKVSGNDSDIYGKVYKARKEMEIERNEAGLFAEQAAASLTAKRFGVDTQARKHYEAGKLPPARIHLRAQRYAVKLFLAHYHHVLYESRFGKPPPKPYIIEHGGRVHYIAPPNWPMR